MATRLRQQGGVGVKCAEHGEEIRRLYVEGERSFEEIAATISKKLPAGDSVSTTQIKRIAKSMGVKGRVNDRRGPWHATVGR